MARFGLEGFFSLGHNINKSKQNLEEKEGVISDYAPELKLEMKDEELSELKKSWEAKWSNSDAKLELDKVQKENDNYWKGKQFQPVEEALGRPLVDNIIFEAVETMLPLVSRKNPEPIVVADNTENGINLSRKVQRMLVYLSDVLKLRLKLKGVARNWALYHLGVIKIGWSMQENEIALAVVRPQKLVLDPDATINDGEYTGDYVGEMRDDTARNLVKRFPGKKQYIQLVAQNKMGTKLNYHEWWTPEFTFWTLKDEVLDKIKNPHWNYEQEVQIVNELGEVMNQTAPGNNHFSTPKVPYIFLSVFNTGKHPFDDTGLIKQNLPSQDLVNKRLRQIDKNADGINGGWAISGEKAGLSKEQAAQALREIKKGGGVYVPRGTVGDAIAQLQGRELPAEVFNQLVDSRNEIRNNFGVRGSTAQGTMNEQTVRGKILIQGQDANRNTYIADYLEQVADDVFNWMVQMMYVYYDEPHVAAIVGKEAAVEYETLKAEDFERNLRISVKEGSLIPEDELTKRNEAIELYGANAISAIDLFQRLGDPDPPKAAKNLLLWQMVQAGTLPPQVLFPDFPVAAPTMLPGPAPGQTVEQPQEDTSLLNEIPIT